MGLWGPKGHGLGCVLLATARPRGMVSWATALVRPGVRRGRGGGPRGEGEGEEAGWAKSEGREGVLLGQLEGFVPKGEGDVFPFLI